MWRTRVRTVAQESASLQALVPWCSSCNSLILRNGEVTWRSELLQRLQEVRGNCKTRNQLDKSLTTRSKEFYQAQRPKMASPRQAAYHSIVRPYVCGATHALHTCRGAGEDLITATMATKRTVFFFRA